MSRFAISFLLFLLVNILTASVMRERQLGAESQVAMNSHTEEREKTWTKWALLDYAKQKDKAISMVFLGSSLVLTPVNLADANFLNQPIDGALHHESCFLNHLVTTGSGQTITNFNFALPGLMPSDAYLITKLLLRSKDHPQLIIYGVGPRDFVDNLLASPTSTDPYHCLSKLLNVSFTDQSWQSKLDYFLAKQFGIYGNKEVIGERILERIKEKISSIPGFNVNGLSIARIHEVLPTYNAMSIGIKQCMFSPVQEQMDSNRFAKDFNEYRLRYRRVNWDTFTCQTKFFLNLLKVANKSNIKVLVIGMPITTVNRQLLPEYIYSAYKKNLRVLSKPYGAAFLDLDSGGYFNDNDFGDTVHLNTTGSIKLIRAIANYLLEHKLCDDRETAVHLADTGVKI